MMEQEEQLSLFCETELELQEKEEKKPEESKEISYLPEKGEENAEPDVPMNPDTTSLSGEQPVSSEKEEPRGEPLPSESGEKTVKKKELPSSTSKDIIFLLRATTRLSSGVP